MARGTVRGTENKRNEPNAQNSELDPGAHPSGARIEKMYEDRNNQGRVDQNVGVGGEKGERGETLRPSERPPSYIPTQDQAEGERDENTMAPHRMDPEER